MRPGEGLYRPATPTLTWNAPLLQQTHVGPPDPGAVCTLYYSPTVPIPIEILATEDDTTSPEWSEYATIDPGYYACVETGNGTNFAGNSFASNVVHIV
jgi:hypothetical protein